MDAAKIAGEWVITLAKVGDAVPAIGASEVENLIVTALKPLKFLWRDQIFAEF